MASSVGSLGGVLLKNFELRGYIVSIFANA